jgi:hypothetical protein
MPECQSPFIELPQLRFWQRYGIILAHLDQKETGVSEKQIMCNASRVLDKQESNYQPPGQSSNGTQLLDFGRYRPRMCRHDETCSLKPDHPKRVSGARAGTA